MAKAPLLNRRIQGTKRYRWRLCPYYTEDASNRIPLTERRPHPTTSGHMKMSVRSGHDGVGWVCEDPNCSYFLGTATTTVKIPYSRVEINRETGEYTVNHEFHEQPICSGTFFWEK